MTPAEEIVASVEEAFAETGRGLEGWADPHPYRMPLDEEYSRVTNPHKWQILAARAEAWLMALGDAGLAEIHEGVEAVWEEPPRLDASRAYRAIPRPRDALPLVVAMERLGDVVDAGVSLGVGNPSVLILATPYCGCDACDSGSQAVLDELDEHVLSVVTGTYRRLKRGKREITVVSEGHWGSREFGRRGIGQRGFMTGRRLLSRLGRFQGEVALSSSYHALGSQKILTRLPRVKIRGPFPRRRRDHIERILANPKGWNELSGASWLAED